MVDRNVVHSSSSNLTDSLLFLSTQFWPENSQGASQGLSLSSRNSQQSSQEGSDPKFLSTYHTKPLLFGDLREKPTTSGILDKFEEDKKNAKERTETNLLVKECQCIRETLNNMQQMVSSSEKDATVVQTVAQHFDKFASLLQNNLNNLQRETSDQFDTVVHNVNSQKEMLTDLDQRVQKSGDITAELYSQMEFLKRTLESLKVEQERERLMLEEALKHLSTLVSLYSLKPSAARVTDSAIQTSPVLLQSMLNVLQEKTLTGTQNLEKNQVEVPRQDYRRTIGKNKCSKRLQKRLKKRPLGVAQKSKCVVADENQQPVMSPTKDHLNMGASRDSPHSLVPLNAEAQTSESPGCFITPLNFWSEDSSSSVGLLKIEPGLEKPSIESSMGTRITPTGFWQLLGMNDSDGELWQDD